MIRLLRIIWCLCNLSEISSQEYIITLASRPSKEQESCPQVAPSVSLQPVRFNWSSQESNYLDLEALSSGCSSSFGVSAACKIWRIEPWPQGQKELEPCSQVAPLPETKSLVRQWRPVWWYFHRYLCFCSLPARIEILNKCWPQGFQKNRNNV